MTFNSTTFKGDAYFGYSAFNSTADFGGTKFNSYADFSATNFNSYAAGLRVGEMTQIMAEDVDFSKAYLHVPAVNAKLNKPRTVVLLPQVAEAIAKQLAGRSKGWLFRSYREGHISSRHVQNILDGIATRAGLQEVKRQDKAGKNQHRVHHQLLRHGFAVWSLDSGVPVGNLQEQLGHASLATTGIYLKASPNRRREAYMRSRLPSFLAGDKP